MGARVTRFVEINYAAADVTLEIPLQWSAAIGNWGKVTSPNKKVIVIFKQQTLNPKKMSVHKTYPQRHNGITHGHVEVSTGAVVASGFIEYSSVSCFLTSSIANSGVVATLLNQEVGLGATFEGKNLLRLVGESAE